MTTTVPAHLLRLRQRRMVGLALPDRSDPLFQREVLDLLADLVRGEIAILPNFQALANAIVAESIERNSLPSRPKHRHKERVIDSDRKRAAVKMYMQLLSEGATDAKAASEAAIEFNADSKTIGRWAKDAHREVLAGMSEFDARAAAAEIGLNPAALLPAGAAPGTDFVLHIAEHHASIPGTDAGTPPIAPIGPAGVPLWVPIPPAEEL